MGESVPSERRALHTTTRYDAQSSTMTVVADVNGASVENLRVFAGRRAVTIERDDEAGGRRTARPPAGHRFTDDRRAVLHNGVLEVTVGLAPAADTSTDASGTSTDR